MLHRRALQLRPVGRERRKKRRRREETSLDAISVVVDMVVIVARQLMIDSYSSSDVIPKEKRGKTSVPDDGLLGFLLIVLKSLCDLDKLYDDDEARFCVFLLARLLSALASMCVCLRLWANDARSKWTALGSCRDHEAAASVFFSLR